MAATKSNKGKTVRKSPDTRAAIMAALLAGQGVCEVAKAFKVSDATVSRLRAAIDPNLLKELESKKAEDFTGLIGDYLRETLTTLSVQAVHFRNATWLNKQSADELAVLHGVQADKAFRILEAIERASDNEESQEEPS